MQFYVGGKLRILTAAILILTAALLPQEKRSQRASNPGTPCGEQSAGLPDFYYEAVLARINPPDWGKSLIRVVVGGEIKLVLWTDGEKFKLWTDSIEAPQEGVNKFLLGLDQSCRLPADPAEAAALVKVRWDSTELSASQFAQIHRSLISSLSQYVSIPQQRYESMMQTKLGVVYLDASGFRIAYDNSYERVEVWVWNDPKGEQGKPLLHWIHGLQKLAEESFHRPIWPREAR